MHYGFLIPMVFFLVVPLLIISLRSVLTRRCSRPRMRDGFVQAACWLNELADPELTAVMMRIRRKPGDYDVKRQDLSRK